MAEPRQSLDAIKCHACKKSLGVFNGDNICPMCRYHFCTEHWDSDLTIKLHGLTWDWDPLHGQLTTVCINCFSNRPGFNGIPMIGLSRGLYAKFQAMKQSHLVSIDYISHDGEYIYSDKALEPLERLRMQNRIQKISKIHSNAASIDKKILNAQEQKIVPWSNHYNCDVCHSWIRFQKKHHCRLCGNTICASKAKSCSLLWSLDGSCIWVCKICTKWLQMDNLPVNNGDRSYGSYSKDVLYQASQEDQLLYTYHQYRQFRSRIEHSTHHYMEMSDNLHNASIDQSSRLNIQRNTIQSSLKHDLEEKFFTKMKDLAANWSVDSVNNLLIKVLVTHIILEGKQWSQRLQWDLRESKDSNMRSKSQSSVLFGQRMRLSQLVSGPIPPIPKPQSTLFHAIDGESVPKDQPTSFIGGVLSSIFQKDKKRFISPLDPDYRNLLIEQRVILEQHIQDAIKERKFDHIGPLRDAIEEIDTQLRREYE
jgi:hypothetical protein